MRGERSINRSSKKKRRIWDTNKGRLSRFICETCHLKDQEVQPIVNCRSCHKDVGRLHKGNMGPRPARPVTDVTLRKSRPARPASPVTRTRKHTMAHLLQRMSPIYRELNDGRDDINVWFEAETDSSGPATVDAVSPGSSP